MRERKSKRKSKSKRRKKEIEFAFQIEKYILYMKKFFQKKNKKSR